MVGGWANPSAWRQLYTTIWAEQHSWASLGIFFLQGQAIDTLMFALRCGPVVGLSALTGISGHLQAVFVEKTWSCLRLGGVLIDADGSNKLGKRPAWRLKHWRLFCRIWAVWCGFTLLLLGGLSFWRGDKPASKKTPHFFWNKPPEKLWWNGCCQNFGFKALVFREKMENQETTNNINWITHRKTNLNLKWPIEKEKCIFQTSILGVLIRTLPKNHCWSQPVEFPLSFMRRWICTERCERSHHCASVTHFNGERIEGRELVD